MDLSLLISGSQILVKFKGLPVDIHKMIQICVQPKGERMGKVLSFNIHNPVLLDRPLVSELSEETDNVIM